MFQVAEFFTGSGHHEKAVQLLVRTRHVEEALDLCSAHNILVTEEMADHMTPPKTPSGIYIYMYMSYFQALGHIQKHRKMFVHGGAPSRACTCTYM